MRWRLDRRLVTQDLYSWESIDYLTDLATPHLFAQRAISLCDFFRERWEIGDAHGAGPATDDDIERTKTNSKSVLALPHSKTFLRPDDEPESYHKQAHVPNSWQNSSASGLSYRPFPLQGDPLKKVLAVDTQAIDNFDSFEAMQKRLEACGFETG